MEPPNRITAMIRERVLAAKFHNKRRRVPMEIRKEGIYKAYIRSGVNRQKGTRIKSHKGCVNTWTRSPTFQTRPYPLKKLSMVLKVIKASSETQRFRARIKASRSIPGIK